MELMPAWSRKGYEKGKEEGRVEGREEGKEEGFQLIKQEMILKLLSKGFTPEEVADIVDSPLEEIQRFAK